MTKFTKEEQIQAIYELKAGYTLGHADIAMLKAMARQLLAGMDQEPVAFIARYESGAIHGTCDRDDPVKMEWLKRGMAVSPLYAAPQLPQPAVVVSDEVIDTFEAEFRRAFEVSAGVEQLIEIGYQGEKFSLSIRDAATWWKLGRAAMLQGKSIKQSSSNEHVSQPYTLPEGMVIVPVEPTREMRLQIHPIAEATCKDCGRSVTADCEDNVLLSWADMIAAAPQQEVATDNTTQQFESLGLIVTSDERKMEVPHCSKHPETELLVHPLDQLMSYPPQPVMYCPLCKPSVAEWARRQRDGK